MKKIILCAICAICGFTTANAQAKFGHVNTQEIIQAMPEYTKAKSEIDALQQQYEADLKSMQDELQKKAEAFDKEQATLPDNIKQRRNQELQDMYTKIQQGYHHQGSRGHQNRWSGGRLCLHHGDERRYPLHQHHAVFRCHRSGQDQTGTEVILVNSE